MGLARTAVRIGFLRETARFGVIRLMIMSEKESLSPENARVVSIRRSRPVPRPPDAPVENLAKYEQIPDEPDDYKHRMAVNVVAFIFIVGLIGAGFWLADTMATMRKNQDCVLSGRRGCTPVEVSKDRW